MPPPPPGGEPPDPPKCADGATAGDDPILLANQSAVTEPFVDFTVHTGLRRLGITRTYTSDDWSYSGGTAGIFGRGWHHEWEASLSCGIDRCTVARGLLPGFQFMWTGSAPSPGGTETWQVYTRWSDQVLSSDHRNILVMRPSGEWIAFLTDGSELHFATVCDACSTPGSDPYCQDPLAGGKARLTKVVDAKGNAVQLAYDRPRGVPLALSDGLGHILELRSAAACSDGLVSSLRYDGMTVATYGYNGLDLATAVDADGSVLRSYVYDPSTARLQAVMNESGDPIAEFTYDATGGAIGIIDRSSSISVSYTSAGPQVTEFYGNTSSTSARVLDLDGHVTSVSDQCACGPARTMTWKNRRLVCSLDAMNHVTWQDFDAQGRLTYRAEYSSTLGCGSAPSSTLPSNGSRERWWDYGLIRTITQGFDLALDAASAVWRRTVFGGPKYIAEEFSYDPTPQPIDPPGYACQVTPLTLGSVLCRRIEGGYTRSPSSGAVVFERHATFFSYDERGRLVQTLGPVNLDYPSPNDVTPIEVRAYWPDGETLARRGRLKQILRYPSPTAAPLVTSYDYDAFGPFQVTSPDGSTTTFVRDGRGRVKYVLSPDGGTRERRYHDGQDPRLEISPTGGAVRYAYDAKGRVAAREFLSADPEAPGATPSVAWGEYYTYDAAGNRIHAERRDAAGAVIWAQDRQYDVQHRVVGDIHPDLPTASRTSVFDASGVLRSTTDEVGRATSFTPDAINRVVKVTRSGFDGSGAPVSQDIAQYTFGPYGDAISQVTDARGQFTRYEYDDFGRLLEITGPNINNGGRYTFTYDARGNLLTRKKFTNLNAVYTYDGLDRAPTHTATDLYNGLSVAYSYRYDEGGWLGRLTSIGEPDRVVRYGYDGEGRLTSESVEENGVSVPLLTQYGYDLSGAVTDIVYPSGLHVQLVRDRATGEVVQVKNLADGTLYADQVTHAPGGPVEALALGNGIVASQTFNRRYEPQAISSGPLTIAYGVTPAGDVRVATEATTTVPVAVTYAYDANGNRIGETAGAVSRSFSYVGGTDQVARRWVTNGASTVPEFGFAYDYVGNIAGVATFDASGASLTGGACWMHDALGRLVAVGDIPFGWWTPPAFDGGVTCIPTTMRTRFLYDARNRRIARWDAVTNEWAYTVSDSAGNPLSELVKTSDPSNPWAKRRDYVWLDGKPLAQIEYPGPTGSTQGYVYYFHLDQIGLPRALTNQQGQTVWSATAGAFGDVVESTATDPLSSRVVLTNLRLPGQYDERLLTSIGFQGPYYNWHRWYLPAVGRYLELDPLALRGEFNGEFGPDWYGYGNENPLRFADPFGLCSVVCMRSNLLTIIPPMWACWRIPDPPPCSDKREKRFIGFYYADFPASLTFLVSCAEWDRYPRGPTQPFPPIVPWPRNPNDGT